MSEPNLVPQLEAYFNNRPLLWRNVGFIFLCNLGWTVVFMVVTPLMQLRLNSLGVQEGTLGLLNSINSYVVSYLVMYFSWKSDHTVSRFGRRIPYLFISSPFIIVTVLLFPFFKTVWLLMGFAIIQMIAMDLKASTFPLLSIDCIPRTILARIGALSGMIGGIVYFFTLRYGMKLADFSEIAPYFLGGILLIFTTLTGGLGIKEPPIKIPATESFKPWSALKIGWRDRRAIVLMMGVALVNSFMLIMGTWMWLWAKNALGFSRTDCGAAISWSALIGIFLAYPNGYIIDRWGSYRVLVIFLVTQVMAFFAAMNVESLGNWANACFTNHHLALWIAKSNGLVMVTLLTALAGPFYYAADIMVYKSCHPSEVGSVTSSNSFIRNCYNATLIGVSGYVIEHSGHNYRPAFIIGIIMSFIGFGMFFVYRRLMSLQPREPLREKQPAMTVSSAEWSSPDPIV